MALTFVLDEQLRGPLWRAISRYNSRGVDLLDVVRVGDMPDLPLGSEDPAILLWAEREFRLVITEDRRTMLGHLQRHLALKRHCPGLLIVQADAKLQELLAMLQVIAHAGRPDDFRDVFVYIP